MAQRELGEASINFLYPDVRRGVEGCHLPLVCSREAMHTIYEGRSIKVGVLIETWAPRIAVPTCTPFKSTCAAIERKAPQSAREYTCCPQQGLPTSPGLLGFQVNEVHRLKDGSSDEVNAYFPPVLSLTPSTDCVNAGISGSNAVQCRLRVARAACPLFIPSCLPLS
jgi:hypothetical protein